MEFILSSFKPLWTCHQDPLSVYLKKVRTFPHISDSCHGLKCTDMLPVIEIFRLKNRHFSLIFHSSGTDYHIVFALIFKYLRISYMAGQSFRVVLIIHNYLPRIRIYPVLTCYMNGIILSTLVYIVKVSIFFYISCIEDMHDIILYNCRA